jgi:N-acetylneuraminic acid mutarotase
MVRSIALAAALLGFGGIANAGTWKNEASLPTGRWAPAAASLSDGTIYVIGGQDDQGFSTQVDIFNPDTRKWVAGPGLPDPGGLGMAAATARDGRIFVFGAVGGQSSVLFLKRGNTAWKPAAPVPTPRSFAGAATGKDGRIYVVGGSNANNSCNLNVLEIYSPATNQWTTGAPMPTPRCGMGVARGSDGRIYAIGGRNGTTELNVVEAYSPSTNSWIRRAPLPSRRGNLSATSNGAGLIYAIGGATEPSQYVRTTNVYSPTRNRWWTVSPTLIAHVDGAAVRSTNRIFMISGLTTGGGTTSVVESRASFCSECQ